MRAASARKRASPQPPSSLAPTARSAVSVRGSTFLWLGSARPRLGWPDRQFVAASFDYDALPWERDDEPTRPARDEEDGAKRRRIKAPTLAELTIEDKELCRLRRLGMTLRDRITVPKVRVTTAVPEKIHEIWRKSELVQRKFHEDLTHDMKTTHELVEGYCYSEHGVSLLQSTKHKAKSRCDGLKHQHGIK